jgi:hypothetical protein
MGVVEAALAGIGLLFLITFIPWWVRGTATTSPVDDTAGPYREGLDAAIRMQAAAQELERHADQGGKASGGLG